ncbi:putative transcriptional regulator, LysR family protein [Marmoricola endophyticus]|uniref:Transcriptional regulator, LysR family protein n=1 Tax=Marmoricola endophyticus TaxID=2040280 RepID=A0A917BFU2_9ACTN|nr:LysR family transcriptional regulator [Marmoricola endophyticus]GGF40310.1 putative transcriptional regulator, LysR family protein [Marmoricola endophyticus]
MEIRQLQYFLAVARELNFTRAARTLHITVPPLTRQIQSLEHELEVSLFDRSTHHVALTEAGEKLFVLAGSVVAEVEAIPTRLRPENTADGVRVSVPFSLSSRVRNAVSRFISEHSGEYVFAISQVPSKDVSKAIRDHRVDLALTHVRPAAESVEFCEVDHETMGVLVDVSQFEGGRSEVSAAELSDFSYIHGPRSWEIAEMLQAQRDLFAAGVVNHADERYDDLAATLIALDGSPKLTIRSQDAEEIQGLRESTFRVLPVSDVPMAFTTYLAWRRGADHLTALREGLAKALPQR